ncbi:MAG: hypothetical protein QY332_10565 [Anaerolineales bacterium]|nr:MAG: hypothetical protein QY332_10565 [Anaerolineales bacterium]
MFALTTVLLIVILVCAIVYGRALLYSFSEEHKIDERIKEVTRQA